MGAKTEILRLNRILKGISEADRALMRARSEQELLESICNIIVDVGGYSLAWIGRVQKGVDKIVKPISWAGESSDYLKDVKVEWGDTPLGQGPTGIALRSGVVSVVHDTRTDPKFEPWRAVALERGYLSTMAFPLISNGKPFGVIAVYNTEANTINEEEVRLFGNFADNIVFGIEALRNEEKREQAEAALRLANDELERRVLERTNELQHEVEQREHTALQLRSSEQRFRDIAESSSDWFWEMGPDLRFTHLTDTFRASVGIDPKDVIGSIRGKFSSANESSEKFKKHLADLETRLPFQNFEYEVQRTDGTTQFISISGKPFFDVAGNFIGYRGAGTNITERVLSQQSLNKLSLAVEQSPNAIFITDTEGIIEYVNPKFTTLTGYSAEEVIGHNPRILKSNETPLDTYADIWKSIKSSKEWRGEMKDRRKDGTYFWINATIAPVTNDHGQITHYVATHEDITERKKAEIKLEEAKEQAVIANRAKSDLMANMSHELRTPLNAIIGFSGLMREETFGSVGSEKNREYLDDIKNSGQHLLELINDILDVSAIEAGALTLYEETISVHKVVEAAVRLIRPRAETGLVTITSLVGPNLPELYADERRVKQVLLNLLSNAVKFTPKGEAVCINAGSNNDGSLSIVVSDNGIGMNASELLEAMSSFGQVDSGLDRKHEGTGLGLPLTKGLMELHSGTLELKSEKGRGTQVTVTFPKERIVKDVNQASKQMLHSSINFSSRFPPKGDISD